MNTFHPPSQDAKQVLQLQATLQAIENYRKEKFDNLLEHQPMEELVFELLDSDYFEDTLPAFEEATVGMLSFLLNPEVALLFQKHFHAKEQAEVADLIGNLNSFFRQLRNEYYQLQFLLVELKRNYDEEAVTLQLLEGKHKAKLEAYMLERSRIEQHNKQVWSEQVRSE